MYLYMGICMNFSYKNNLNKNRSTVSINGIKEENET